MKKVMRPLLFVAALAAVGFVVYTSSSSSSAEASRFWINGTAEQSAPLN